jgi:hypothetical protein
MASRSCDRSCVTRVVKESREQERSPLSRHWQHDEKCSSEDDTAADDATPHVRHTILSPAGVQSMHEISRIDRLRMVKSVASVASRPVASSRRQRGPPIQPSRVMCGGANIRTRHVVNDSVTDRTLLDHTPSFVAQRIFARRGHEVHASRADMERSTGPPKQAVYTRT